MFELNEHDIADLYAWIDGATFSRPKKNLTRDFSDGVACAELLNTYIPKLVDLHNYSPANSISQKIYNWHTLNSKVFKKIGYATTSEIINCVVNMRPGYIEYLLWDLKVKVSQYLLSTSTSPSKKSTTPKTPRKTPARPIISLVGVGGFDTSGQVKKPQVDASLKSLAAVNQDDKYYSKGSRMQSINLAPMPSNRAKPTSAELHLEPPLPQGGGGDQDQMKDTIKLLQLKVQKMTELLELKEEKLQTLSSEKV